MRKIYVKAGLSFCFVLAFGLVSAQELLVQPSSKLIRISPSDQVTLSNAENALSSYLTDGSTDYEFQLKNTSSDQLGFTYQTYQEFYKGLKVEFGVEKVHAKNGVITTLSGDFYKMKEFDVLPSLSSKVAFDAALKFVGADHYLWEDPTAAEAIGNYSKPEGELLILPDLDNPGRFNLAFKFDIYATEPISRDHIYVDARSGEILLVNSIIKHLGEHAHSSHSSEHSESFLGMMAAGNAATRYSGNQTIETRIISGNYALRDNTRGNGVNTYNSGRTNSYPSTNFFDNDNNWTAAEYDNAFKDNGALDAHWGAESTYDYWVTQHGRNSFDGNGAAINSWVHYDNQPGGAGYDNAFWNGSVMTYGDGNSFDILTSLDVAAHEIGHAVTTNTANLAYRRESGAMNEGYSDIWGAAVEHFTRGAGTDLSPSPAVWQIGEDISTNNGLRSMSDPKSKGDPDTYRGVNWRPATQAEGCITPSRDANDYCGVHTNSGVLNHWFYILVAGKSGTNDIGSTYSVSGIGMTKAAQIAYRILNIYLGANSTFSDARAFGIQSAEELFGAGSNEVIATTNAWYAVGIGSEYSSGGSTTCSSTVSSFPYDESFNNTLGAWSQSSSDDINWALQTGGTPSNGTGPSGAFDGSHYIYMEVSGDGSGFPNKSAILNSPCFDLTGPSSVSFNYQMTGSAVGTISLEASTDQGSNWTSIWTRSGDQGANWLATDVNLDAYAGSTVQLRFNGVSGTSWQGDIALDNLEVSSGGASGDTQAPSTPSGLAASGVTQTELSLNWNASSDNVGVTGYDVYSGTTNIGQVATNSANITGLTASTSYSFRVKAIDAAGNESGFSNTVNVTTASDASSGCTGGIASFPYNEGFENTLGAWTNASGDDLNWQANTGGTPSGSTGPSSGTQGSYYLYVEVSGDGTGYPNKQAILNSPCFDISSTSSAYFNFSYHMYGAAAMGSLSVEISTDDGTSWTGIWSRSGNLGNSWQSESLDLGSYIGSEVQLRFNTVSGTTWQGDIAIDDVSLTTSQPSADICDGVLEYVSTQTYSTGDRVIFQGSLYERTSTGWTNLGPCGTTTVAPSFAETDLAASLDLFEISIYPNPVSGSSLNIASSTPGVQFSIINTTGQSVGNGFVDGNTIDISSLQTGIYLIQFVSDSEKLIKRFIKE
ncbi:MAG: M4 family metallopeptidase [Bacteroidota bacterium]